MPSVELPLISDIGLQSDGPKKQLQDDQLSVAPFIRRLVNPILSMPPGESFVVAIYGPWGYGKSTALNFMEEELFRASMPDVRRAATAAGEKALPSPIIVRFTPWLYGDVETLLSSFFETLSAELNEEISSPKKRKRLANALSGIGEFVTPAAKVAVGLMVGPAGVLVTPATEAVGGGIKGLAKTLDGGEVAFAKRKEEAAKILVGLAEGPEPRRIVVMIDDLDRAAPAEIIAMLKLMKLIADLPNISYVVALDKERVTASVADTLKLKASEDFLEKIIQVGVDLPPFGQNRLASMIVDGAQAILRDAGLTPDTLAVEWSGWRMLLDQSYIGSVRRLVRPPREVVRILNAYRFALLTAREQPEVHAVDLLLLCVLQVLRAGLYGSIRDHQDLLLGDELRGMLERVVGRDGEITATRTARAARLVAMFTSAGVQIDEEARAYIEAEPNERAIKRGGIAPELEIVMELFPACLEEKVGDVQQVRARRECRISSPVHFQGYFRLDPPPGIVRRAEIEAMYALLLSGSFDESGATAIIELVLKLSAEARESLERGLADMARNIDVESAPVLLESLEILAAARRPETIDGQHPDAGAPHDEADRAAPYDLVTSLLFRAVSALRQSNDDELRAYSVKYIISIVQALPDVFGAQLANDMTHRPPPSLELADEERIRIAESGLDRAEATVRRRYPTGADVRLNGQEFSRDLWRWRRLADLSGRANAETSWLPVKQMVDDLLAADPLVVSEVVALAAGWGDGPSLKELPRAEVRRGIARITDPDMVEAAVRSLIDSGRWQETTWPHLLWQYVGEVRPRRRWFAPLAPYKVE
jgi:hypothetical protein